MDKIAFQEVTLRIPFRPDEEDLPEGWNFQELLDTPDAVTVVAYSHPQYPEATHAAETDDGEDV